MMESRVLVINKPKGLTSHDVVKEIRKIFRGVKVGHAGTLDPLAEGVLLVLIGKATKRQHELMRLPKEYWAEITLGRETDTYDAEGRVVEEVPGKNLIRFSKEDLEAALANFRGEISQKVPPFSAVKVEGRRLYQLARRGLVRKGDLPAKKVTIYELELLDFRPYRRGGLLRKARLPKAEIRLICSSGTYVRSIAHDLGQILGVGAFISQIVRTRVGDYTLEKALKLEEIKAG